MSYSDLQDLFAGRIGQNTLVKRVLELKSPKRMSSFLIERHKTLFPKGDEKKYEKWNLYPRIKGTQVVEPISSKHLSDSRFISETSKKLSFDISRFTEFLSGYKKVDEDIKPIMLYYTLVYLFDFFSRTWLKYGQNPSHGLSLCQSAKDLRAERTKIRIDLNGIFPRAVDAFYLVSQPSLFSRNDESGISYQLGVSGKPVSERIPKLKYSARPEISLFDLLDTYKKLDQIVGSAGIANRILVGYATIFLMSSICRYKAEQWFKIEEDRDLKSKLEMLYHDSLYEWIPVILIQPELESIQ